MNPSGSNMVYHTIFHRLDCHARLRGNNRHLSFEGRPTAKIFHKLIQFFSRPTHNGGRR